jgi:pyruvate dehydrogenase E1 component alpha subunit
MSELLSIYRHALRARLVDERLSVLARAGRIGFHPDAQHAETVIVAAALALGENDWVFPTARDHAAALARGVSLPAYLDHVIGNGRDALSGHAAPGCYCSREKKIAPPTSLLSQHLTQAMGLAWALKLRKEEGVVLALLPETAADAGDFHSAVNFAGVTKAPIVFVVRTDGSEAPAPDVEVADKGVAYGVPSVDVTGDPLRVFEAVRIAADLARRGNGPTLIEARISVAPDPLLLLRTRLIDDGAFTESDDLLHRREVLAEIEAHTSEALSAGVPSLDSIFEHVHAELPPHLVRQRDELRAVHTESGLEPSTADQPVMTESAV